MARNWWKAKARRGGLQHWQPAATTLRYSLAIRIRHIGGTYNSAAPDN